jgi:hypothetical protein
MRRMNDGLVPTLDATASDVTGAPPCSARKVKTCTATAKCVFIEQGERILYLF